MNIEVSLDREGQELLEEIMASDLLGGDRTPEEALLWALRTAKQVLDGAAEIVDKKRRRSERRIRSTPPPNFWDEPGFEPFPDPAPIEPLVGFSFDFDISALELLSIDISDLHPPGIDISDLDLLGIDISDLHPPGIDISAFDLPGIDIGDLDLD
jgi:hypothetical protein